MAAPEVSADFYQRLEYFARSTGLSLNAFGLKVGFNAGAFSRILRDQSNIGVHHIISLVNQYPELSIRWLLLGEGPMLGTNLDEESNSQTEFQMLKLKGENEALKEVLKVWSAKLHFTNLPM